MPNKPTTLREFREKWPRLYKHQMSGDYIEEIMEDVESLLTSHSTELVREIEKWAEENSKEISDSYPWPSRYDCSDFISLTDLKAFLISLINQEK